jgi:hypothetical protein
MATNPCVDCDYPLEETAKRCPVCGSKDPFGKREKYWLIAAVGILLSIVIGAATLFIRLQWS